jgi:microcystin-dependent protein
VPVNNNFTYIDQLFGAVTVVAVSSSNVTLSTSQCQNAIIRLTGTLSANIQIIFPTVAAIYTVENLTTGNYYITCGMASGAVVGVPQGIPTQIFTDGTNTKYWNTALPGTFMDYAGSTLPGWMSASTTTPWLICDGSAVSRTTYSTLYSIVGTTWGVGDGSTTFNLPDLRNRVRVPLGGNRLTSAGSGIDGSAAGQTGGSQNITIAQANLPNVTLSGTTNTVPDHQHSIGSGSGGARPAQDGASSSTGSLTGPAGAHYHTFTTSSINGNVTQTSTNVTQPTAVHGITLIKT